MSYIIRNEEPKDYFKAEEGTREAFWNLYRPGCDEHLVVHNLRKHGDFIPELTFVMESDGEIVGSIYYSYSKVIDDVGNEHRVITFGPVSILPRLHRKGLGRRLITHSIDKAKELGFGAIIIAGYPYHYKPYGFIGTKKFNISMPDGKFYTGIMALPLFEGALDGIEGKVYFSEVMEVCNTMLEEFDKKFPHKEKLVAESHAEFEAAVAQIDNSVY